MCGVGGSIRGNGAFSVKCSASGFYVGVIVLRYEFAEGQVEDVELWFAHAVDGRAVFGWMESDGDGFAYHATHSATNQSGWTPGRLH
jgi:hypothetical protein